MNGEAKIRDPLDAPWQPVAVVSLGTEPKPRPPRSLGNFAWGIGLHVVLMSAMMGGLAFLTRRWDWTYIWWQAATGAVVGAISGVVDWLRRRP